MLYFLYMYNFLTLGGGRQLIKILIVEDDPHIAKMIAAALDIVGYKSEQCDDGRAAVSRIMEESFSLVLLDVMLPGLDGFSVMGQIRSRGVPVIFLTAMQEVSDRVRGLRSGAEDYIVKPFEVVELLARIEVVLRRTNKAQKLLTYEDIQVDLSRHTVKRSGKEIALTPKEFDLLAFFIENADIALTRERLLAAVWGYDFAGETRTVDIHVQQLRAKLKLHDRLMTIPKLGYRLEKSP